MMEKITVKDFEEMIIRDRALAAEAKEITGEGEEKKEKIAAFAASLGYEIDFGGEPREFSPDEMENAAGGFTAQASLKPALFFYSPAGKESAPRRPASSAGNPRASRPQGQS